MPKRNKLNTLWSLCSHGFSFSTPIARNVAWVTEIRSIFIYTTTKPEQVTW